MSKLAKEKFNTNLEDEFTIYERDKEVPSNLTMKKRNEASKNKDTYYISLIVNP